MRSLRSDTLIQLLISRVAPAESDAVPARPPKSASVTIPKGNRLGVAPPLWRQHYDNIVTMRASKDAPVDSVGCCVRATVCA